MKKINIFKRSFRTLIRGLIILLSKILIIPLRLIRVKLIPPYNEITNLKYKFSDQNNRIIYNEKKKDSFDKIFIDTSLNKSMLCNLGGEKYPTNKSPYHEGFRSGFTGFYNLLFVGLKNKKINFAEIGIETNNSIKMWREYFKEANIYGFEYNDEMIENAKKDNLHNTYYHKINVHEPSSITESFKQTNCQFDIIIDDSTHIFDDQIRVIKNCVNFLKKNGILVVEDIYKFRKGYSESNYYNSLKDIKHLFCETAFVETIHINNYTASWKNEKILLFVKK